MEAHFGKKPSVPFQQALLQYAEIQKRDHPKHFMNVTRYILKRLATYFGNCDLEEVKLPMIQKFIDARLDQVGISTVQRDISILKAILNFAFRHELLEIVPPFPKMAVAAGRSRWLNDEEIERLVGNAAKHLIPIILFAVDTGGRLREILNLDWQSVDLKLRRATFLNTKNGEDRVVPLCERAVITLSGLGPREHGPVFTYRGAAIQHIQTSFESAREKAGLIDVRFHDLRHTFASRLVQGGVSLYDVKHLTGHKSMEMVQRYAHLAPDFQLEAIRVLN